MKVEFHLEARAELEELRQRDPQEYRAMQAAVEKLGVFGDQLPHPHSSNVQGGSKLRELRPRGGKSRYRAFYRRIGNVIVVGSVGPEARHDPQGFRRATADAERRLAKIDSGG